jgi:low affinity Fe/Cu permease
MNQLLSQISTAVAYQTGRSTTFIICAPASSHTVYYRPTFPLFRHMAARHQHSTSVLTFLIVLVIQNTQNRDGTAIQAKLKPASRRSKINHGANIPICDGLVSHSSRILQGRRSVAEGA